MTLLAGLLFLLGIVAVGASIERSIDRQRRRTLAERLARARLVEQQWRVIRARRAVWRRWQRRRA